MTTLQVKLISAQLSRDTEMFSNMVPFPRVRTRTASSFWASRNSDLAPRTKLARSQSGTRLSGLPRPTPTSRSSSWTRTLFQTIRSGRGRSTSRASAMRRHHGVGLFIVRSSAVVLRGKVGGQGDFRDRRWRPANGRYPATVGTRELSESAQQHATAKYSQ